MKKINKRLIKKYAQDVDAEAAVRELLTDVLTDALQQGEEVSETSLPKAASKKSK